MAVIDDLASRVRALSARSEQRVLSAHSEQRVLIGIAGAPGSGKTTLALAVVARLGGFPVVAHVPMDGFHLADAELVRLGRRDRMGAPDTFDVDGYAALLRRIRAGEAVWAPSFERPLEQPIAQAIPVTAQTRVVVSEGNYLLLPDPQWRAVREQFDEVWYCREDEDVRLRRLLARHIEFGKPPDVAREWVLRSDEHNASLIAAHIDSADLVVDLAGVDMRRT
ncbi:MAG TPA: nucleoside/nucleotide kinase family protein [Jatrophihabitantaceae bacterium]